MVTSREYPLNGPLIDDEELFADLKEAVHWCKPIKKDPNAQMKEKKEKKDDKAEPKAGPKVSGRLILDLPHVLQVVHLRHKLTGKSLLVANTHLYWHPRGNNVRTIQAAVCLRLIARELKQLDDHSAGVIFAGDFNSGAHSAAVRHCLGETIPDSDIDFYSSGSAGHYKLKEPLMPPITLSSAISPTPGETKNQKTKNKKHFQFIVIMWRRSRVC